MKTAAETLQQAALQLREAGIQNSRFEAEVLLAHVLGTERGALLLDLKQIIQPALLETFLTHINRRAAGEPSAYITDQREFWSLTFEVSSATLIPRPDSETLVELATLQWPRDTALRVLDLGTGSGCLLLSVLKEYPNAIGLGLDRSQAALKIAKRNAERLGLGQRAHFICGDWAQALSGSFHLILANPPYVRLDAPLSREVVDFEPASALFAGPDGLEAYRLILPQLAQLLAPEGQAFIEIGVDQAQDVCQLAKQCGYISTVHPDLTGRPRCIQIKKSKKALGIPYGSG